MWGGAAVFRLWPGRRRIAMENIGNVLEEGTLFLDRPTRTLARQSFENIGQSFVEIVRVFHLSHDPTFKEVRIVGGENYIQALAKNRGVIMVTGHCGNWELGGLALHARYQAPVAVVARALKNAYLDDLVAAVRSVSGNRIIYKEGAVRQILAGLKNREVVAILIDQAVLVKEGCVVNFLGRAAMTTKLPALIARKAGTPLLPCFMSRNPQGGHTLEIYPEIELSRHPNKEQAVIEDMQTLTGYVEDFIRVHPEQWLWGHRRWKRAADYMPD